MQFAPLLGGPEVDWSWIVADRPRNRLGLLPPSLRTAVRGGLSLLRGRVPGQLVIQYTDACNARCPQCGMRTTERYLRSKLEPAW